MKNKKMFFKLTVSFLLLFLIIVGLGYLMRDDIKPLFFRPQTSDENKEGVKKENLTKNDLDQDEDRKDIEVVTKNLNIPWEIVFLPNQEVLIAERSGRIIHVSQGEEYVYVVEGVDSVGEGGLLGIALHPEFEENRSVYLYLTTETENRVDKYRFEDKKLFKQETILSNIPSARFHNGGRIAFGPDNYLYITTGDAQNTQLAQDRNSLAGKILRVTDSGEIPDDNPFGNKIYSYGHRNPQGLVWDKERRLWSTEHGPTSQDELNLIDPGNNYGWPVITGEASQTGMEVPKLFSGYNYTWAPSGATYWKESIFFSGLRGQAIYEASLDNSEVESLTTHFKEDFGRIRTIKLGPDGMFYILTNNTDGRGTPGEEDDKLIKINPDIFTY